MAGAQEPAVDLIVDDVPAPVTISALDRTPRRIKSHIHLVTPISLMLTKTSLQVMLRRTWIPLISFTGRTYTGVIYIRQDQWVTIPTVTPCTHGPGRISANF